MNRQQRRAMEAANRSRPAELAEVPVGEWPGHLVGLSTSPARVWRSRDFLVQLYTHEGTPRLSVNRTSMGGNGRWLDGITWDQLQEVKRQAGFGDRWAVEVFPADESLVDVANCRHLWLLDGPPSFAWQRGGA